MNSRDFVSVNDKDIKSGINNNLRTPQVKQPEYPPVGEVKSISVGKFGEENKVPMQIEERKI